MIWFLLLPFALFGLAVIGLSLWELLCIGSDAIATAFQRAMDRWHL